MSCNHSVPASWGTMEVMSRMNWKEVQRTRR